jgi:transcriptional regulator with XRE-family HTH domain
MIGQKIKELVQKKGITAETFATDMKMTVGNVFKLYKKDSVSTDLLLKMATYFGVSISYFFEDFYNVSSLDASGDFELNFIPDVATAGYGNGNDIGYTLNEIEKMSIRKILNLGKDDYVLKVEGTSMDGVIQDGELLICGRTTLNEAKDGRVYVFIIQHVGKTVKRLQKLSKDEIVLVPDNPQFQPQRVLVQDIVEVYEIKSRVNPNSIS